MHDAQVWEVPQSYSLAFRMLYRILLPIIARAADTVLTVSQYSASALRSFGIVGRYGRLIVVPNGVDHISKILPDPDILKNFGLDSKRFILLVGNLAKHKNLDFLIDAAEDRRDGAIPLVIAGGGNNFVFEKQRVNHNSNVIRLGRVSDRELRALYDNATALAFPSLTEGFGLPAVEAMACGCPVIATTSGAVPEVCGDAVLYADPRDPVAWTEAMDRVALDADLRSTLSKLGKLKATAYKWETSARILLALLRT